MADNNLPIKVILPRESDIRKNLAGGGLKFFCEIGRAHV